MEVYDIREVNIKIDGELVVRGWRDKQGLWRISMVNGSSQETPSKDKLEEFGRYSIRLDKHQVSNLYDLPSLPQRVVFIHACLGFPTKATLLEAARKGRLLGIPFTSPENISSYCPESDETAKGHMEQQRQGVRLTKEEQAQQKQEHDVHVKVWDLRETTYSDQAGRFPFKSY